MLRSVLRLRCSATRVASRAGAPSHARRPLVSTPSAAPTEGFVSRLLREGQVDSGFFQGSALIGGMVLGVQMASEEQRERGVALVLKGFRAVGLDRRITDRQVLFLFSLTHPMHPHMSHPHFPHISPECLVLQIIEDYLQKNVAAAINVIYASPAFYFLFASMHQQTFAVSCVRAITGSMRIVPFMGAFYGTFALIHPFVTSYCIARGEEYEAAKGSAAAYVLLGGGVWVEADLPPPLTSPP